MKMNPAIMKMWGASALVMISVSALWGVYISFQGTDPLSYTGIARNFAATGTVLFAISFVLTPVGYFFDFLDRKVAYRKYIGILGYCCALVYSIMLMFSDLDFYFYNLGENLFTADVFFGLSAMMIFTIMTAISNVTMMKKLGCDLWRQILRLGYLAYGLLVIRAFCIEWDLWVTWWEAGEGLPPIRIILCAIAITVLSMRLLMWIDCYRKECATSRCSEE